MNLNFVPTLIAVAWIAAAIYTPISISKSIKENRKAKLEQHFEEITTDSIN